MNRLADFVTRYPRAILLVMITLTAVAAVKLPTLRFTFSIRSLYDYTGNKEVEVLDRYMDEFGDDGGFVAAILTSDRIFTPEVLDYIQRVSRALEGQRIFWRVRSLSVKQIPWGDGEEVNTGRLYEALPRDPARLRQLRQIALRSNLVVPRLLTKDGRRTMIAAEMRTPSAKASLEVQAEAVRRFKATLARFKVPAGVELMVGGAPVIETELQRILIEDQVLFMSVAAVLLVVVLLIVFGKLHGILLPLSSVLVTLTWAVGLMSWFGSEINIISSTIPTVLFIYGLLDSIFVLSRFYEAIEAGKTRRQAARKAVADLAWPCLITSATTALGFGAFAITNLPLMQDYGVFLGVGVLFAYLASVAWLPALLCVVPAPRQGYSERRLVRKVSAFLGWIPFRRRGFRLTTLVGSLVLLGLCTAVAATQNRMDVLYTRELPPHVESMRTNTILSKELSGVMRTAVVIDAPPGQIKEPEVIRAIDRIDRWAEGHGFVRSSLSLADIIREMNQAFNGGDAKHHTIPRSRALIAQYLAMMDPDTRSDFVRDDYSRTHIRILSEDFGSQVGNPFHAGLERVAREALKGTKVTYTLTGYAPVAYAGLETLIKQMLWSFGIAFVTIAVLVLVAFRSVRAGLLACVPNLLPTAVCLAILPFLGIALRTGTVLFLSVSVGIIYDNTIHLLARVKELRGEGAGAEEAVQGALASVGPPAIYSALLIAFGFGIFILSKFEVLMVFGVCCVGVVLVGLAADLLLTPSLLIAAGRQVFARGPTIERRDASEATPPEEAP